MQEEQNCDNKLSEEFMNLKNEITENNYDYAKVLNQENTEEIVKMEEQCNVLSDNLNNNCINNDQQQSQKCEEENQLSLEIDDFEDYIKEIEEEYIEFNELKKINKKLQNKINAYKIRQQNLKNSRRFYQKLNKKALKFKRKILNEHELYLNILIQKLKEKILLKKKYKCLRHMYATSKREIKEIKKKTLHDMKTINEYLLQKEAEFNEERRSYLNEINNLRKQLNERNIKNF